MSKTSQKIAIDVLATLAKSVDDLSVLADVRRMKRRLEAKPMRRILKRVPGDTIGEKCEILGVTRTTYYSWLSGRTRPRGKLILAKLAKITGAGVDELRGD